MSDSLNCWKCGQVLDDMPMPLRRRDECPACGTDLHVCRMCEFYDISVAKSCREPVAEEVTDKERANFCDYFRGRPVVHAGGGAGETDAARAQLDALFGIEGKAEDPPTATDAQSLIDRKRAEADDARKRLDELFGDDDES
jgi:hypothetical protein